MGTHAIAFESPITAATDLSYDALVATSSGFRGTPPQWWLVDLAAHGRIRDTSGGGATTPTTAGLLDLPPRLPAHVEIDYGIKQPEDPEFSYQSQRIIDAVPGRYLFWASALAVRLRAPAGTRVFVPDKERPSQVTGPSTLLGYLNVGTAPLGNTCGRNAVSGPGHTAQFTRTLELGAAPVEVEIPAGTRRLQIWDPEAAPWAWGPPPYAFGSIPVPLGQSARVLVPSVCAMTAPAGAARVAAVVWEIVL